MKPRKIAIFRKRLGQYSETFVRQDIEHLNGGETVVVCRYLVDAPFDWIAESRVLVLGRYPRWTWGAHIAWFCWRHRVGFAVVEFLDWACEMQPFIRFLGLRYVALGHGFDVSRYLQSKEGYAERLNCLSSAAALLLDPVLQGLEQRLLEQFTPEGFQPLEASRTQTQHYFAFNLQCWLNLTGLTRALGVDLWELSSSAKRPLARALDYFLCYMDRPWEMAQIGAFDSDRFGPLAAAYHARRGDPSQHVSLPVSLKPILFPHYGVRPFWMLGPEYQAST